MSIFSTITAGLTKAENFLVNVFTKTSEVEQTLASLAPGTKAAVLATFYDTVKTVQAGIAAATDAADGNITGAITLSAQTLALVKTVVEDAKTDGSAFAADLKALGL